MEEQIKQLQQQVAELQEWKRQKEQQQISFPLDQTSAAILGQVTDEGTGSTALTQSIALSGNPESIDVPKAYADTVVLLIGNTRYEIPYLATL